MKTKALLNGLLLAALAAGAAPASAAQKRVKAPAKEPAANAPAAAMCPADDSAAPAGLRAFIDPQTGQLREPTPEEAQALARAAHEQFARELESLEAVVHPDGMISLDLKGLFMQDLVVTRGVDGRLSMQCVPNSDGSTSVPLPPSPAPVLEER
jgi:hypothetical protein